jgi:hypothetical protein
MRCGMVEVHRRFRGMHCHRRRLSQESSQNEAGRNQIRLPDAGGRIRLRKMCFSPIVMQVIALENSTYLFVM